MLYCVDQQSTLIFTLYWQAHFDADYCNIHTTVAGQWVNRAKLQEWIIMTEITQQHPSNCKSKIQKQGVNWQKITQHTTLMMMMWLPSTGHTYQSISVTCSSVHYTIILTAQCAQYKLYYSALMYSLVLNQCINMKFLILLRHFLHLLDKHLCTWTTLPFTAIKPPLSEIHMTTWNILWKQNWVFIINKYS